MRVLEPVVVATGLVLGLVSCTPGTTTLTQAPAYELGLDVGTPPGLEVQSPACQQAGGYMVVTGTVVADGPVQSRFITVRLNAVRPDSSFDQQTATYPFSADAAQAGLPFRVRTSTGPDSANICGIEVLWGQTQ